MKQLLFVCLFAVVALSSQAQLRDTVQPSVLQGNTFTLFGLPSIFALSPGTVAPLASVPTCIDSLQVSDTLAAVIPVNHTNDVSMFGTWYWLKAGSGTATITMTLLQSNDGANWNPVKKGQLDSAYSRIYSLSASGWNVFDTKVDTARLTGRYFKFQLMTSATASVGGKVFAQIKTVIQ